MRKIYLKSLLLTAVLTVGGSAMAQTKLVDFGTPDGTPMSTEGWTTSSGTLAMVDVAANGFVLPGQGLKYTSPSNGTGSSTMTISPTANSLLTYEAVWAPGASTGRAGNRNYLQLGDVKIESRGQDQKAYVALGDDAVAGNLTLLQNLSSETRSNNWWKVTVSVNQATGAIAYQVTSTSGKVDQGELTLLNGNYTTFGIGFTRGGRTVTSNNTLRSIVITEKAQTVQAATYTINYKLDGTAVKTVEGESAEGAVITAENPIEVDGARYFVVDGAETSKTLVAGANTFEVAVRQAKVYNYDVKDNLGKVLGTGKWTEGDADVTVSWSKYVKKEDKWYVCEGTTFSETVGTASTADVTKVVNYTEADGLDLFYEAEAILSGSYGNATDNSFSGGASAGVAIGKSLNIGLVSAGTYDLTLQTSVRRPGADKFNVEVSADNAVWQTVNTLELADNKGGAFGLVLSLGTDSYVRLTEALTQNQFHYVDYVTLTAKPAPTVEINAASKVASYSSAQAVTVPEDVMIYIATETSASEIVLTKVEGRVVPANTGVVLYSATPGMKTLAYGGEATADFAANKFVATGEATFAATGSEYALVKGEQSFAKVAAGVEIPANKAYVVAAAGAKLNLDFGTLTAIEGVEAAVAGSDAIYNLAGQKVSASYKGIVVKGGKKHIVK